MAQGGEAGILGDVIDVYALVSEGEAITSIPADLDAAIAAGYEKVGTLNELMADGDGAAHGVLYAEENTPVGGYSEAYAGIVLHMQEEAGNEYQGLSVGTTFDIVLNATQYTYEEDGFGSDQYDANIVMATPDTFAESVQQLPEGGTLMLSAGVYDSTDVSMFLQKRSGSIIGAGADETIIKGAVRFGTNNGQEAYEGGSWTVKGVTIANDNAAPQQLGVALASNEVASNCSFTIEDCVISGFQFGTQIGGSLITDSTLTVKNTKFVNCACAISVGGQGNELVTEGVTYEGVTYTLQDYRNGNTYYTVDGAKVSGADAVLGNAADTISVNGKRYADVATAISEAANGDTVYLGGGNYGSITVPDGKMVSIAGAGIDATVADHIMLANNTSNGTATIKDLTVARPAGQTSQKTGISFSSTGNVTNSTLNVENCKISGYLYGVAMNSAMQSDTLNVSNLVVDHVFCALSVKTVNSDTTSTGNTYSVNGLTLTGGSQYALQTFYPNQYFAAIGGAAVDGAAVESSSLYANWMK